MFLEPGSVAYSEPEAPPSNPVHSPTTSVQLVPLPCVAVHSERPGLKP